MRLLRILTIAAVTLLLAVTVAQASTPTQGAAWHTTSSQPHHKVQSHKRTRATIRHLRLARNGAPLAVAASCSVRAC
jgi:Spy/CpxP family protein refolding chaperone